MVLMDWRETKVEPSWLEEEEEEEGAAVAWLMAATRAKRMFLDLGRSIVSFGTAFDIGRCR